jgi:metal-responsive CopG/Arc/MetJ family transcriptional regulator
MRKHPVSINLSKEILKRIDQAAKAESRNRSDWVELHFTKLFYPPQEPETEIAIKTG